MGPFNQVKQAAETRFPEFLLELRIADLTQQALPKTLQTEAKRKEFSSMFSRFNALTECVGCVDLNRSARMPDERTLKKGTRPFKMRSFIPCHAVISQISEMKQGSPSAFLKISVFQRCRKESTKKIGRVRLNELSRNSRER